MKTDSFDRRIRSLFLFGLGLEGFFFLSRLILLAGCWFLVFSLLDNLLSFSILFRWLNILSFLYAAGKRVVKAVKNALSYRTETVLKTIEDRHQTHDTIISAFQLKKEGIPGEYFLQNLQKSASENLKKIPIRTLAHAESVKNAFLRFMLLAPLLAYYFILPANFTLSLNRFLDPGYRIKYTHTIARTDLEPKDLKVLEGRSALFTLKAYGQVKNPRLILESAGSRSISEEFKLIKRTNEGTNRIDFYQAALNSIYHDYRYHALTIQTRDQIEVKTPSYQLRLVKPPLIRELKITYFYPSYTLQKPVTVEDNGNIEAVEKTAVRILGRANNGIRQASLVYNAQRIPLAVSGNAFNGRFLLNQSGKYHIRILDENDNRESAPVEYSVTVTPDEPPEVEIIKPGMDINVPEEMTLRLEISARDDYAVNELKFFYRVIKETPGAEPREITLPAPREQNFQYTHIWDLNELSFLPGDTVEYFAQAWDGYEPAPSHTVRSRTYRITFPTMGDMYSQMDREDQKSIRTMEDVIRDQNELYREADRMLKDMENRENLSYTEKKRIEKLKENQAAISRSLEDLNTRLKQSAEKVREKNLHTPDIFRKMQDIQKLLSEVMDRQMKESMEKLSEILKDLKISEQKKSMLGQKFTQEEILKRLDKTLEMLKALKEQKKLEGFRKLTEELIKKQQDLLNRTAGKKTRMEDLKKIQESVRNDFSELKKSMKDFEQELKKEKSALEKDFSELNRKTESLDPDRDFRESSDALKKNNPGESARSQKQALSKLDRIRSEIAGLESEGRQMDLARITGLIDGAAFHLLQTSFKIEQYQLSLKRDMNPFGSPPGIKDGQEGLHAPLETAAIAEDLIFTERTIRSEGRALEEGTREEVLFHPDFFKKFDDLAGSLQSARDHLSEGQVFNAHSVIAAALMQNNLLIKTLIDLKEELKDQMQQAGNQGMDEALNRMADAQQKLNELTQRLQGQAGKEALSPELEQYLEELSFQQEMIRRNVESFLQNFEGTEKLLGDLGQAAKEMEEIREKLKSRKVDQNLVEKQNRVLKRLLDSQKSLYTEDHSKERKAESAKEVKRDGVPELAKEKVRPKSRSFHSRMKDRYPLEYKKLVDDYFRVLGVIEQTEE